VYIVVLEFLLKNDRTRTRAMKLILPIIYIDIMTEDQIDLITQIRIQIVRQYTYLTLNVIKN